jgi:NAD(P) transhydrogenase subunit alpha
MMMTAAGTVRPAKVFVMGAGVAGLQAIATAKRLGAVVSATDVRPAAKEQVESLGGKFIAVEDDEFKQAETAGGYAKQMSAEYQSKQAELTAQHIAKQDIVITTALIPGRPAPRLITRAMVESMAPGSVIVDLAAERGGNVELTQADQVIEHNGVRIVGYTNVQGRIPTTASQLYARNLLAFVSTLIDANSKTLAVNWDDELVKAVVLTRNGQVVHPSFAAPAAVEGSATQAALEPLATKPLRKATARKTQVPAMADTPKKAVPGVEQSIPAAADPQPTPAKKAATKKATAVINAALAAKSANPKFLPDALPEPGSPKQRPRTRRVIDAASLPNGDSPGSPEAGVTRRRKPAALKDSE